MYTETTMAADNAMPMPNNRPSGGSDAAGTAAVRPERCAAAEGTLPGKCGDLAFPYIAMQGENPARYDNQEALENGTLFPGLHLPFHRDLKTRFPAVNQALSELMALDFAIDELGLYLTTHPDDQDALQLYWSYIRLADEGRKKYEAAYGPLLQTTITPGAYQWLNDPWPWEKGGND